MFLLAHMGIGSKLAKFWIKGLPIQGVLLGAVLPDVLDKGLYYGGKLGNLCLVSGTRTFGHTALLVLVLSFFARAARSKLLVALALGMASHLLLDLLGDLAGQNKIENPLLSLLWPLFGWGFPVMPYGSMGEQLGTFAQPLILAGEVLGALLLGFDYWKRKR